jgi:hypothetical protein
MPFPACFDSSLGVDGKIFDTRNITQPSILKNGGYAIVMAAAVFVF